ncbi:MAG: hypothetical protein EA390_11085 [Balneolaceae bacterium]|nr:MAG: hypothetical protein EA390_11085 [Balneolaceae bacterium]
MFFYAFLLQNNSGGSMDKSVKNRIFIGGTFAAGMLSGALLSSIPMSQITGRLIGKSKRVLLKERRGFNVRVEKVKRELANPLPDLYKATESLSLSEEELFRG